VSTLNNDACPACPSAPCSSSGLSPRQLCCSLNLGALNAPDVAVSLVPSAIIRGRLESFVSGVGITLRSGVLEWSRARASQFDRPRHEGVLISTAARRSAPKAELDFDRPPSTAVIAIFQALSALSACNLNGRNAQRRRVRLGVGRDQATPSAETIRKILEQRRAMFVARPFVRSAIPRLAFRATTHWAFQIFPSPDASFTLKNPAWTRRFTGIVLRDRAVSLPTGPPRRAPSRRFRRTMALWRSKGFFFPSGALRNSTVLAALKPYRLTSDLQNFRRRARRVYGLGRPGRRQAASKPRFSRAIAANKSRDGPPRMHRMSCSRCTIQFCQHCGNRLPRRKGRVLQLEGRLLETLRRARAGGGRRRGPRFSPGLVPHPSRYPLSPAVRLDRQARTITWRRASSRGAPLRRCGGSMRSPDAGPAIALDALGCAQRRDALKYWPNGTAEGAAREWITANIP